MSVGILAYGSIRKDPGWEIEKATSRVIKDIKTPFEIEYARKSGKSRSNAPTLVRVNDGKGAKVTAEIFILMNEIGEIEAKNMLYRREISKVGKSEIKYDHESQLNKVDPVLIESLSNFPDLECVLYTDFKVKHGQILNDDLPHIQKARLLANLAVQSVSEDTYFTLKDGIQYLADCIEMDILTPLTALYKQEILKLSGDARDLEEARYRIAEQKGII